MKILRYSERLTLPVAGEITVLLVRHGASQEDLDNQFCGWCDSPMVDFGHRQMVQVAQFLEQTKYGTIYTDDLVRTDESAKYLLSGSVSGRQVKTPLLRAWGLGSTFSGQVKSPELEAKKKYYVQHPDEMPPGIDAETLNHNKSSWMSGFTYVVSQTVPGIASVIVCHSNGPKILSVIYQNFRLKLGHGGVMAIRIAENGVTIDVLKQGWVENENDG